MAEVIGRVQSPNPPKTTRARSRSHRMDRIDRPRAKKSRRARPRRAVAPPLTANPVVLRDGHLRAHERRRPGQVRAGQDGERRRPRHGRERHRDVRRRRGVHLRALAGVPREVRLPVPLPRRAPATPRATSPRDARTRPRRAPMPRDAACDLPSRVFFAAAASRSSARSRTARACRRRGSAASARSSTSRTTTTSSATSRASTRTSSNERPPRRRAV